VVLNIKIIEWLATASIIIGSITLSFEYQTISTILFSIGSILWVIVGINWHRPSLIVTNVFIILVYVAGFVGITGYLKTIF